MHTARVADEKVNRLQAILGSKVACFYFMNGDNDETHCVTVDFVKFYEDI